MNCIGFPDKPRPRQRFRLLFKHLLLAGSVILAQSGLCTALALEPVVSKDALEAPANLSTDQTADRPINQPTNQTADQPTNQPTNQPINQATNLPADLSSDLTDPAPTSSSASHLDDAEIAAKGTSHGEHYNPTDLAFVSRYLKNTDYIPVSEIKPGMEGYGLTVFQGTKIEKFNVKVIGIIRKALNGRDAILIRISGEKLGKNNVVRGMSGSPIYLNGRLCARSFLRL